MREPRIAIACVSVLFLSACDNLPGAEQSRWSISSKVDPLTDKQVSTALATYSSTPFSVQAEITCGGDNLLEYQLAAYDEKGEGAPLNASASEAGAFAIFTMRLNDAQAQNYVSLTPPYNNAISIVPQSGNDFESTLASIFAMGMSAKVPDSIDVAKANRVVLKLQLRGGDAVVEIDQSERPIREFLNKCLAGVPSAKIQPASASMEDLNDGSEESTQSPEFEAEEREAARPSQPPFSQYSVETSDHVAELRVVPGTWFWDYRTRIRNAYSGDANFAANATVTLWGCGTGCRFGALVDRLTGEVHEIPLGGEDNMYLQVQTKRGSNLLLANWEDRSGDNVSCVFEAMVWTGTQFNTVEGFPKRMAGTCPLEG